ncbi:MAG TPA: NAD-glutamate dehydrogenase domain-containing protein [Anaeromyxobacteraceae bacterium]|jgi:glutamate dehydrogenase|nr:NAD-glutamate dehydrogenase domain-containing protein [Anaeromyxobacteraceae bacterium]
MSNSASGAISTVREEGGRPSDRGAAGAVRALAARAPENLRWLHQHVPDVFAGPLREDGEAVAALAGGLLRLAHDRQLVLADRESELILARLDTPGSIFETLQHLRDREISCAEMFHSSAPVPGTELPLELQRYQFAGGPPPSGPEAGGAPIPDRIRREVHAALRQRSPELRPKDLDPILQNLWLSHEPYLRHSPPQAIAQLLWLYQQCQAHGGIFLHAEDPEGPAGSAERNVLFAVSNPPQQGYLMQVMEVFNALDLGVRRSLALAVGAGTQPWFLGSFYVAHRHGEHLANDSDLFRRLRRQLYNTQILSIESATYRDLVLPGVMTGEEASLVNAFIGFCHTNCAHNQPHRYTFEDVIRCFHSQPEIALELVRLFEARFDPEVTGRDARYPEQLLEVEREVTAYNTGHRMLDEFRRSVFQTALAFVRRTLKTNFFVPEKQALAFRLDPAYLEDLGPEFTADLPPERPFRVTFFFGRAGLGYHIGFSDIARGGWRTVFTETRDDYVTVANTVFRETYVLAHTQHLKNKDIYEGGSKMVVVLRAPALKSKERVNQRLYKVQTAFLNAFLDIFVTRDGKAADPRVVDYYGEDEPIELGPDENLHDVMIEAIAAASVRRGYLLGTGIISSKQVGINHKQYGVTSTGVVTFAGIAMREQGIDIRKDPFSVKLTGGPNGDVAGNALRLLLERCPGVQVRLIVDGTAALFDPRGLDRAALSRVVLRADADAFDPAALSPGGFALYRNVRRTEGLRELFRRVEMTPAGPAESWVTVDEFYKEYGELTFKVPADLFIPAGGRPETVDEGNWQRFFAADRTPTARVIVEGANSFITPGARDKLQEAGIVLLRDASANKCGVITSSYEIIGNLLLSEKEFLAHKEEYVRDVLAILERRAADEAELIFRRHREGRGQRSFTAISNALSLEINAHKARLFQFFQSRPELGSRPLYRRALLAHLPRLVREHPKFRSRLDRLPAKYRSAILAAEIATAIVYRGGFELDFEQALEEYVARSFT